MSFEEVMVMLRRGYHMRRANWFTSIGWTPGSESIQRFWRSGFVELWRPTLADIQATDWERAT